MEVVMSTGQSRLHFFEAADALGCVGVKIKLVSGWVPRNPHSWLVRFLSKVTRHNIAPGMAKRTVKSENVQIKSDAFSEFFFQFLMVLTRRHPAVNLWVSRFGWIVTGFSSRRYLKDAQIFHVRSGGGHGGAIRKAHKLGMKVIADHSIAHPDFLARELEGEYKKNGKFFSMGMKSPLWRLIAEDCQLADVVVVNSNFVKDTFIEAGYPESKVKVVYWGIRNDFFGVREKTYETVPFGRHLLFTGTFNFRKGAEYIIDAVKSLRQKGLDFTFDVAGTVVVTEAQRKECAELGIKLLGVLPQDELKGLFERTDIYVFPSLAEGCARSGVEAMGAGLCAIATKESGLPITDGETGLLVPTRNAAAIAEKIEWLFDRPDEVRRIGSAAAKLVRTEYTWEKYAENMKRVYEEVVRT